jgi:hypothetical protein
MSRTTHHSLKWGPDHRHGPRTDNRPYGGGRIGEAPGWHVRLYDERPGRRGDHLILERIRQGSVDADEAILVRNPGRKPHKYYW